MKNTIILLLLFTVFSSTSYAQRVEGRLVGSQPNFSIQLRATAPFVDQGGITPVATPITFVIKVNEAINPSLSINSDPLNFGTPQENISGNDVLYGFVAGVSEFDLTTLSTSFSTYVSFTYSGSGQSIDLTNGKVNLISDNILDLVGSPILLPVELSYFTARAQSDNTSLLNWETTAEINNDYFRVQHSINGLDFDEIGTVEGNGTTSDVQRYKFIHHNPVHGTNYYRLTQVDFDGESEDSPIRSVEFDGVINTKFKVFPNPSDSYLIIIPPDTSQETWNVGVYDTAGKRIQSFIISDNFYHLNTTEFPDGIYHLQVNSGTQSNQLRFVKQ